MKRRIVLLLLPFLLLILAGAGYAWVAAGLPSLAALPDHLNRPSVRITDRQGRLLYEVLAEDSGRNTVLPLEKIPVYLQQATIATEDRSFYSNPGVDLLGILRAVWINLRGGETLAGGSTITQQVARTLLMDAKERSERSLRRKLRESLLAWRLAQTLPKVDVLALYLNQTNYGGMSYGVEAAAQTYFGKPAAELDLAESALLAGLPQAPSAYNPFSAPEAAKNRQKVVLDLMVKAGDITRGQADLAAAEPLVYAKIPYPIEAPHFVMWVREQLDQLFTPEDVYAQGGLVVRTSLDLDWQHHAERAVTQQMQNLRQSVGLTQDQGLDHNLNNAALVALDPHTGEILAMVGSPDYFDPDHSGAVNMAVAPRQPGSALKPLIYATAFDPSNVQPYTSATMLLDVRTNFVTHDAQAYTPANYDGNEHGPVLVREALASSLNIPAVLALEHIGLPALFNTARSMGITTLGDPDGYDLSLALGGGDVTLLELTGAYSVFANGGVRIPPVAILEVSGQNGRQLYKAPSPSGERVIDPRVAWLISDILSDDDARVTGFGRNSILRLDRPAAVKTGTTTDFHDNWTIGYTPDLVVGVWAGNASYAAMRNITGLTGAAPIWHQFIRTVLEGQPSRPFVQPPGLVRTEVCALSGLLPAPACTYRRLEWFIDGTQPRFPDTLFRTVLIDSTTGRLAGLGTPSSQQVSRTVLDLPPQAQPWAQSHGVTLLSSLAGGPDQPAEPLPGQTPGGGTPATGSLPLTLLSPGDETIYQLAPGLSADAQSLHLLAVGEPGLGPVTLYVDGIPIATFSAPPYEAWWPLSAGAHEAWAGSTGSSGGPITSNRSHFTVH